MSSIQSIVVPVDFSEPSRAALARAAVLAERLDASIHLVHAARFPMPAIAHEFSIPEPAWETVRDAAQQEVDRLAAGLLERGLKVSREVSDRDTVDAIGAAVEKHGAGLIVMGTHGHRGVEHFLLGSVAERVIRTSAVPVMAVKENTDVAGTPIRKIMLATDFSEPSHQARDFAVELAKATDAPIELFHSVAVPTQFFASYDVAPPGDLLDDIRDSAASRLSESAKAIAARGVQVETRLVEGPASEAISDAATKTAADVIVMGTRGNSGLRHVLLGSVAERTLRRAPCSVIAVRPTE